MASYMWIILGHLYLTSASPISIGNLTNELLFLCSYDIFRVLEQNGKLLNKPVILF